MTSQRAQNKLFSCNPYPQNKVALIVFSFSADLYMLLMWSWLFSFVPGLHKTALHWCGSSPPSPPRRHSLEEILSVIFILLILLWLTKKWRKFLSQGVLLTICSSNLSCPSGVRAPVFADALWSICYQFLVLHASASYQFHFFIFRIFFLSVEELVREKRAAWENVIGVAWT